MLTRLSHDNVRALADRKLAKADGSYIKEEAKMVRQHLLILDDFGIQPFDAQNRDALMEIIEDRHDEKSTISASQVPVAAWHDVIRENTVDNAVLDRIIRQAHRLELMGESLRRKVKTED